MKEKIRLGSFLAKERTRVPGKTLCLKVNKIYGFYFDDSNLASFTNTSQDVLFANDLRSQRLKQTKLE